MAVSIPINDQVTDSHSIRNQLETDASEQAGALFLRLIADYFAATAREEMPVSAPPSPAELARRFDEPLPKNGQPLEAVAERLVREVVAESNHLSHPMYLGHQVSAPLPAAVWTESLISALNNSVAVREMSPAATAIEHQVIRWMNDLLGYGPDAGGTLTSGGTEATFTALLAARAAALPGAWQHGVGPNPPMLVCGEHAHYAVSRAAGELGLGLDRVVAIPSRNYRMDTDALAARLEQLRSDGTPVMAVVATAGSTATGSFDDLAAIGQLCDAHGIWFHVDGAHGASALLSARHHDRVRGIELARSVAWDPHKMMLLPLSAGMVLVRSERDLDAAYAQRAPYLFHGGEEYVWDQGVRSFACSRRTDVIKLWVALQRYGANGIGALYEYLCDLTAALHRKIQMRGDFVALHQPESNILCFRWVGARSPEDTELDRINLELRQRYNATGAGWITTTVLEGIRVLRVTIMNPRTTESHLDRLLDGLTELAATLA